MLKAIKLFLLLFASIGIGIFLQADPGYFLIAYKKWTVESTLLTACILLVLTLFVIYVLYKMLTHALSTPKYWRQWKRHQKKKRASSQCNKAVIEFGEGNWAHALKLLTKYGPDSENALIYYLLAAQAAHQLEAYEKRNDYIRQAQQRFPQALLAAKLTLVELQLTNHEYESARASLKSLYATHPNHPQVLTDLVKLLSLVGDWSELIDLLPHIKRQQLLDNHKYDRLCQKVYIGAISDMLKQEQYQSLNQFIEKIPVNIRYNPEIIAIYARYLIANRQFIEAEVLLKKAIKKTYNEELILLYAEIGDMACLTFLESYIKHHENSANLMLALGMVSKHHKLWGKARKYLEQSIALKQTTTVYKELGLLLEQLNDSNGASQAYRDGLLLQIPESSHANF